jgi:hypothetical protein
MSNTHRTAGTGAHTLRLIEGTGANTPSANTPQLTAIDGGLAPAVLRWEAELERLIATTISSYVAEAPCPGPSVAAEDLVVWGDGLLLDAQQRLREADSTVGGRRLAVVG